MVDFISTGTVHARAIGRADELVANLVERYAARRICVKFDQRSNCGEPLHIAVARVRMACYRHNGSRKGITCLPASSDAVGAVLTRRQELSTVA